MSRVPDQALKDSLLEVAQEKAKERQIVGCCVYGSQVAGYAKPDSDYDLIVALKDFRQRVRYVYTEGPPTASLLLVHSDALTRDAEAAALGEFVAGRLLNPYIPIVGEDYLQKVEYALKRRIVVEILRDLLGEIGPIATEVLIPPEFFLFEKLKLRMAIYPPVTYSYVKTYSGPDGKENTDFAVRGFNQVLEELSAEGTVDALDGHYRLLRKLGANRVLARALRNAYRGVSQYAVHGFAGRVGWKVVAWEAASKLNRIREVHDVPTFLSQPRSLLALPEGKPIFSDHWEHEILSALSLENPRIVERKRAGLISTREFWSVQGNNGTLKVAIKKYSDIWSLKWALVGLWALPGKRFSVSPAVRMAREYRAMRVLRKVGVGTPRVLALAIPSRVMATELVDGTNFESYVERFLVHGRNGEVISKFGELMGLIHATGWTLGDAKPENMLVAENGDFVFVDLEQAEEGGDPSWDLAVFFYYSLRFIEKPEAAKRLTQAFAESYAKHASPHYLRAAAKKRYLTPFQPIVSNSVAWEVKSAIEEVLSRKG